MTQTTISGAVCASKKELLRGSLLATLVAGVLLVGAVLPAEYGIDPTGLGKSLGLTALYNPTPTTASVATTPIRPADATLPTTVPSGSIVSAKGEQRGISIASKQAVAYRGDSQEYVIPPRKGIEVKTHLAKDATLIFSWKTKNGEVVNHDFHGEPINAGRDEFESFILEKGVKESRGSLIAPFTGVHGWYWKNNTDAPITVVLTSSGFYSDIYRK
jgi:hypothetical protein